MLAEICKIICLYKKWLLHFPLLYFRFDGFPIFKSKNRNGLVRFLWDRFFILKNSNLTTPISKHFYFIKIENYIRCSPFKSEVFFLNGRVVLFISMREPSSLCIWYFPMWVLVYISKAFLLGVDGYIRCSPLKLEWDFIFLSEKNVSFISMRDHIFLTYFPH